MRLKSGLSAFLKPDPQADRVVPPTGFTAQLTTFTAAAMAFLAVFALALSMAAGKLAERWAKELAGGATIRISAPPEQQDAQVAAALRVLETTAGVAAARALTAQDQKDLLAPWFGNGLDLDSLPVPRLIEVTEDGRGFDPDGLRLRLSAEAPGAVLDDHARWREPLLRGASRLRLLGLVSIGLITASMATMITLAANSALAANAPVIAVLRLVGATDRYIADAFVRRFTLRAASGAVIGSCAAIIGILLLPTNNDQAGILSGLGFVGKQWVLPFAVPPLAGLVAYFATRASARRTLETLS